MKLGINGLGRIGKLSLWHHVSRKHFSESIDRDSSYGRLGMYLHGCKGSQVIENLNDADGTMTINGVPVKILREARNPAGIQWKENGVRLVVDTTGAFTDPTADADSPKGALRGHVQAGAEKVLLSAPFKIKNKGVDMPADAVTTVMGINDGDFNPSQHTLISAASCTTTCLSFMIKPLLDHFGADRFLSASMVTVHAATGSQQVLDRLPNAGATDLRKSRSIFNNIILTTTGAAKALPLVIPEMKSIGFIAESVRIPTNTGSLIVLVLNLQDESMENPIKRKLVNSIYRDYAKNSAYLEYSDEQHVSTDIIGLPFAAAVIEGSETHTRTASLKVNLAKLGCSIGPTTLEVPVTQAVVYAWYDNELGSYTNVLGDRTVSIAEQMI
ncbi:MAG: glyceraldehyde-3-phosphate dehydrogenase [Deltaproteobacteria bacterium HGW-Deltaproteobacteria-3]|nr:MAG: glyceraldehyde-3-phosphate dehydrogenase [Deltaproteobacteria bacterium HGW-Deltaproteobacteria-3]